MRLIPCCTAFELLSEELMAGHQASILNTELLHAKTLLSSYRLGERQFNQVNLSGGSLIEACLVGVSLQNSVLNHVNLSQAVLASANLMGSRILEAMLWRTDLSGADLRYSHLMRSRFLRSCLSQANFTGASLVKPEFDRKTVQKKGLRFKLKVLPLQQSQP